MRRVAFIGLVIIASGLSLIAWRLPVQIFFPDVYEMYLVPKNGHWFAMLTTAWWMMSSVKAVLVKIHVPENDWRVLFSPVLMLFLPFYGFIPFKPHWYQITDVRNNTGA